MTTFPCPRSSFFNRSANFSYWIFCDVFLIFRVVFYFNYNTTIGYSSSSVCGINIFQRFSTTITTCGWTLYLTLFNCTLNTSIWWRNGFSWVTFNCVRYTWTFWICRMVYCFKCFWIIISARATTTYNTSCIFVDSYRWSRT